MANPNLVNIPTTYYLEGMSPALKVRQRIDRRALPNLQAFALAFHKAFGRPLIVTEAARSRPRQTALWNAYQSFLRGGPFAVVAARPFNSIHDEENHGTALDLGSGIATRGTPAQVWAAANCKRYGLTWTGINFNEAWHYETSTTTTTAASALLATIGSTSPAGSGGTLTPIPATPTEEDELMGAVDDINANTNARATDVKAHIDGHVRGFQEKDAEMLAAIAEVRELALRGANRGDVRMVRNSDTGRVALVGETTWIEPNTADDEYALGRQYGLRAPGEHQNAGDWFAMKYAGDILVDSEFVALKERTQAQIKAFSAEALDPKA